jgi:hypothetical protein
VSKRNEEEGERDRVRLSRLIQRKDRAMEKRLLQDIVNKKDVIKKKMS